MAHTLANTLAAAPRQGLRHLQGGCQVVIRQSLGEIAQLCLKLAAADTHPIAVFDILEEIPNRRVETLPQTFQRLQPGQGLTAFDVGDGLDCLLRALRQLFLRETAYEPCPPNPQPDMLFQVHSHTLSLGSGRAH